jgi:hypothetical protein
MSADADRPKRHHWWPQAQSRFWTAADGKVCVTRADGTYFRTSPTNIGVESELYTRFTDDDQKDVAVEDWFAAEIDGPARVLIEHLLDPTNSRRRSFRGDPEKAETVRQLGYKVNPYLEEVATPSEVREAIARYVAALLVRHPSYLSKLVHFHSPDSINSRVTKNRALDNMVWLHGVYTERMRTAAFVISRAIDAHEFLYADGGVKVEEPWKTTHGIPFDVHAPITPELAVAVLPLPDVEDLDRAAVMECTNQGVARLNRIVLGVAQRFVFSRQVPPSKFIAENFGKPAPKNIGYRVINGRLESKYDPNRT